ncbi:MAG: aminotransferase class V-fold PLP-dependent enzyme [Phycisphaeraceae bacterium]|nr:aminotransferase class V-fold PLP-dependent enzyme [Phycisphaeraceae bacterium]
MRAPIYLDNAATSFPKPECVHQAVLDYMRRVGASPGRGAYGAARDGAALLGRCRERLLELVGGERGGQVIFTLNATDALNLAIKGVVRAWNRRNPGRTAHVVTTAMDHNSVLRPLNALAEKGEAEWTCVEADAESGLVEASSVHGAIRAETALVVVVHASNVTGTIQPVEVIGAACRRLGVPLLVDAAQSLGHMPVNATWMGIDLLAFPGHKGLLGPLGTGGLYLRPGMEALLEPLREGGTGSASESDVQPAALPDRFEPGSHNTPGIAGLSAASEWLLDRGVDSVRTHEARLIEAALDAMPGEKDGFRLLGLPSARGRMGVFSFAHEVVSPASLASGLEARGYLVRSGLHCAPRAHASLGTLESGGAVRISLGPFMDEHDVRGAMQALAEIAANPRSCEPDWAHVRS